MGIEYDKWLVGRAEELYTELGGAAYVSGRIVRALVRLIQRKDQEIELLRVYGNKDCTAMADEQIELL